MALILELDVGNTAIKWRRLSGAVVLDSGRIADNLDELEDLLDAEVSFVRVASVAFSQRETQLKALLVGKKVEHEFAVSQAECAGVRNGYDDVSSMGVDRWLAMVAAYNSCREACVIIDAGTALTIDVIDRGGQHHGGYILPGAELALTALGRSTGKVRFGVAASKSLGLGKNTGACVHNGKWLGLVGAVQLALHEAEKEIGVNYRVYVTGGDGVNVMQLAGDYAASWHYSKDLVLDGLALVLAKA